MRFFTFVWKGVLRRKTRSVLTTVGLAVAVAAVVSLVGISRQFERSFLDLYNKRGVDLVVQRGGTSAQLSSGLNENLGNQIRRLPGVKSVVGGLMDVVSFEQQNLYTVIVDGWPADSPLFEELNFLEGRRLKEGDRQSIMLGRVLAANLGKKVGDQVEMYTEQFKVVGIFESYNVYENGAIIVLLPELQRLMDRPHEVTGFVVQAKFSDNREELDRLSKHVESLEAGLSVQPAADFIKNINQIRIARAAAWVISAIALVIGAIGMLNTMVMSVFERTKEIGTLRAIGWRKSRVVRMILWEALLLSLGGACLGSLAAVLLAKWLSSLPTTSVLVQGNIAPAVVLQGFLLAVLVGVCGAAYPAYWGATLRPVDALRSK